MVTKKYDHVELVDAIYGCSELRTQRPMVATNMIRSKMALSSFGNAALVKRHLREVTRTSSQDYR